ncbi:MAG: hypothetical protein VZR09_04150 [Candidatus Gastranaerophilaceae bacterium]|nr:hypothetical protein [Candidatus Gastranaerophilaceae bacterium]
MKKTVLSLFTFLLISVAAMAANVIPEDVSISNTNTFGVYQVGNSIVLYSEPDENSAVKEKIVWSKDNVIPQNLRKQDLFVLYLEKSDFALMAVTDETEDWVEVIYNSSTGDRGWIKKDDPYKFNTWVNFYNMYGRKYGLKILKGSPESVTYMYGSPDSQKKISTINHPSMINLNFVRGNWMLVTVVDIDRTPKTGFIRWRSDDGIKYLFPDIK